MAAEAEGKIISLKSFYSFVSFVAAREARAKIIAAEGEQKASRSLKVRFYLKIKKYLYKKNEIFFRKQLMLLMKVQLHYNYDIFKH